MLDESHGAFFLRAGPPAVPSFSSQFHLYHEMASVWRNANRAQARVLPAPPLDARPGLLDQEVLPPLGERIRSPDEVLVANGVSRRLHVLDEARVELRGVLQDLDPVPAGQRGGGIPPHQREQLAMGRTLPLHPGKLRILAGAQRRKHRQRVRPELLPQEVAALAEGLPIPAEEEIDQQAHPRREHGEQHPGQGGRGPAVLQDDEHAGHQGVQLQCGPEDGPEIWDPR